MSKSKKGENMSTITELHFRCSVCYQYRSRLKEDVCIECHSCAGKNAYTSRKVAFAIADWFNIEDGNNWLSPYSCSFCEQYHLGNSSYLTAS